MVNQKQSVFSLDTDFQQKSLLYCTNLFILSPNIDHHHQRQGRVTFFTSFEPLGSLAQLV